MATVSLMFQRMPAGHHAVDWGRRYADDLGHAWQECPRGDWLLWLAGILEADPRLVTLAACDCARFALSLLPDGKQEDHLRPVLDTAARWAQGEGSSVDDCRSLAQQILAIYKEAPEQLVDQAATAGYATSAVSAAVNVPTFESPFGVAAAAAAAALASAQVAAPNDEDAIDDAHRRCAELVRARIPFQEVATTRGFQHYARLVEPAAAEPGDES